MSKKILKRENLIDLFHTKTLNQNANKKCFIELDEDGIENGTLTYGELRHKVIEIASFLKQNYSYKKLILLFDSNIDYAIHFYACLIAKVIVIPIMYQRNGLFEPTINSILDTVIHCNEVSGILLSSEVASEHIKLIENISLPQNKNLFLLLSDQLLVKKNQSTKVKYELSYMPNDIAIILRTSGSTGKAKFVPFTHGLLTKKIANVKKGLQYDKQSITVSWLPHSHMLGWFTNIILPVYSGSCCVSFTPDTFIKNPNLWLESISNYKASHSAIPSFALSYYNQKCTVNKSLSFENWKVCLISADIVRKVDCDQFYDKFLSEFDVPYSIFCPHYGMTETGPISNGLIGNFSRAVNDVIGLNSDYLSVGKPFEKNAIICYDFINDKMCNDKQIGSLLINKKNTFEGYLTSDGKIDNSSFVNIEGKFYFKTGDYALINQQELFIVGREKELIVVRGKKYYFSDLENVLRETSLPNNFKFTLFSIEDDSEEKLVMLYENFSESIDHSDLHLNIQRTVNVKFGIVIDKIVCVAKGQLKTTVTGKILKKACKESFLANEMKLVKAKIPMTKTLEEIDSKDKPFTYELIKERLFNVIQQMITIDRIKLEKLNDFSNLFIDSVKGLILVEKLKQEFSIPINISDIYRYYKFDSFIKFIDDTLKGNQVILNKSTKTQLFTNDCPKIAIIGMDCLLPSSDSYEEFWRNLTAGKNCLTQWESANREEIYSAIRVPNFPKQSGFIKQMRYFDAAFFNISPREATYLDPQQRKSLEIAWKAIEDAGYNAEELSGKKIGVIWAYHTDDYKISLLANDKQSDPTMNTGLHASFIANRISYFFNFKGPSVTINSACSGAVSALEQAMFFLQNKRCDMVLVGGVNTLFSAKEFENMHASGLLSPDGICKPCADNANGIVRAEGCVAILLKRLSDAKHDNDMIHAVLVGAATSHGGKTSSITSPNPDSEYQIMFDTLNYYNISFDTVDYLELHGTGTKVGDPIELSAVNRAFKNRSTTHQSTLKIGSVKGNIGHTESVSGFASIIKCILQMKHNTLVPTINIKTINKSIILNTEQIELVTELTKFENLTERDKISCVNSFGLGGTLGHVILQDYPKPVTSNIVNESITNQELLFVISAKSHNQLKDISLNLHQFITDNQVDLIDVAYSLQISRKAFPYRHAFIARNKQDLLKQLSDFIDNFSSFAIDAVENEKNKNEKVNDLTELKERWLSGDNTINWNACYYNPKPKKIRLPRYPFMKEDFWFEDRFEIKDHDNADSIQTKQISVIDYVKGIISENLGVPIASLQITRSLESYGLTSILVIKIVDEMKKMFAGLNYVFIYQYQTIFEISEYISKTYPDVIEKNFIRKPNIQQKNTEERVSEESVEFLENDIAIIGIAGIYPGADNIDEYWQNLKMGRNCVAMIPENRWQNDQYYSDQPQEGKSYTKWLASINNVYSFDPLLFNISPKDAKKIDPQERKFLEIAYSAIEDAGYTPDRLDKNQQVGVFVGVMHYDYTERPQFWSIANRVSYVFNFKGPSYVIDSACSSSLSSIQVAVDNIINGRCNVAIAGGVNLVLSPKHHISLSAMRMLTHKSTCTPFDDDADGIISGEGAGAFILKKANEAINDHDNIYGIIKGIATNSGGKTQGYTVPNPEAQTNVIMEALHQAKLNLSDIDYIETHGTGTALGDPIEIFALKQVADFYNYSTISKKIAIGSVKSNIGHLESAAGAASLTKVLLQFKYNTLTPTINFQTLNKKIQPELTPFYIQEDITIRQLKFAGISSFGAGGSNAHMIIQNYIHSNKLDNQHDLYKHNFPILLSTNSPEQTNLLIRKLYSYIKEHQDVDLSALAYTLQHGRVTYKDRCAFTISSVTELMQVLQDVAEENNHGVRIFRNFAQQQQATPLSDDEIKSCLEKNDYEPLIDYWVSTGSNINWTYFVSSQLLPYKISLPTYPFLTSEYREDLVLLYQENMTNQSDNISQSKSEKSIFEQFKKVSDSFLTPISEQDKRNNILICILDIFCEILAISDKQDVDINLPFIDYGLDSIKGLEFVDKINQSLNINLNNIVIYDFTDINRLTNYIHSQGLVKPEMINSEVNTYVPDKKPETKNVIERDITHSNDQVAIIGLSCRFADIDDVDQFWNIIVNKKTTVKEIERWSIEDNYLGNQINKHSAHLKDIKSFDHHFFNISKDDADVMDPQHRIFLEEVWKALEDAGYAGERLDNTKTGVFVGISGNDYQRLINKNSSPNALWGNSNAALSGRVSFFLNLKGASISIDTACSSSLVATHLGCQEILQGRADIAIVGGSHLIVTDDFNYLASAAGMLSLSGKCSAFDESADGFVPGEGAAVLILKNYRQAIEDRDHIYGVIAGSNINQDGRTNGITAPSALSQEQLLKETYQSLNVDVNKIQLLESHGTGTKLGDPIEVKALKNAFMSITDKKQFCAISSTKPNIGHTVATAGVASVIKTLLCMKYGVIPGLCNFNSLNSEITLNDTPFYINNDNRYWPPHHDGSRWAGINSFGSTGTNVHLIVKKSTVPERISHYAPFYLFCLSSLSKEQLIELARKYLLFIELSKDLNISNLCYTLATGRALFKYRLVIIAIDKNDLIYKLQCWLSNAASIDNAYIFDNINHKNDAIIVGNHPFHYRDGNSSSYNPEELYDHLKTVAKSLINGEHVSLYNMFENQQLSRISLPKYVFKKITCWVNLSAGDTNEKTTSCSLSSILSVDMNYEAVKTKVTDIIISSLLITDLNIKNSLENLHELTINSLQLVEIRDNIKRFFDINLPLEFLIGSPSINDIVELIIESRSETKKETNDAFSLPLLFNQRDLYLFEQFYDTSAYSIPLLFSYNGYFDIVNLTKSFNLIKQQHNSLNVNFTLRDDLAIIQQKKSYKIDIEVIKIASQQIMFSDVRGKSKQRFDLTNDKLVRICVYQLEDEKNYLFINVHHIIMDGWSIINFVKESITLYEKLSLNEDVETKNFSSLYEKKWQEICEKVNQNEKSLYWVDELNNLEPISLPIDHRAIAHEDKFKGNTVMFSFSDETVAFIEDFSHRYNSSIFGTLLSIFVVLIHSYTLRRDFCVGVPFNFRNKNEEYQLFGYLVNMLPIRINLHDTDNFIELNKLILKKISQAMDQRYYSFSKSDMHSDLFNLSLSYMDEVFIEPLIKQNILRVNLPCEAAKFHMLFDIRKTRSKMELFVDYNENMFTESFILDVIDKFILLTQKVIEEPSKSIMKEILSSSSQIKELLNWN